MTRSPLRYRARGGGSQPAGPPHREPRQASQWWRWRSWCHLLTVGGRQLAVLLRSQAREEITEARLRCGGAGEPVRIKRAIVADDPCRHGAPPPVLREIGRAHV